MGGDGRRQGSCDSGDVDAVTPAAHADAVRNPAVHVPFTPTNDVDDG